MKKIFYVSMFVLILVSGTTVKSAAAAELTFGYVPAAMQYPYIVASVKGFKDEAKKVGVKTIVIDPQGDVEKQSNAIDDLITEKVDGIGFMPLDSIVAKSMVDRIADHKIPVVAISVEVGDPSKRPISDVYPRLNALVAPDDVLFGEQAAKLAVKLLPKDRSAKIAIIEGAPGFACVPQRTRGFKKGLDEAGVKYKIVASQPTDWTPEKGEAVCQNFLSAHPDLDLIFSQADDMAIGCSRAIDAVGSKVKLIATAGGSKLGDAAIKAGELDGSVDVRPETLGRLMFRALYEAATNPNSKKGQFITIPLPILTKKNVDKFPPQW